MLLVVVLAIVQGIAEFLPISSSLHLNFFSSIINHGYSDVEISSFCILLNLGTLLALCWHYRQDVWQIMCGFFDFLLLKKTENREYFLSIAIANIPTIVLFGYVEIACGGQNFSNIVMLSAMIIFSIIMFVCDKIGKTDLNEMPYRKEWILVGIAQLFSMIPGVSRLGSNLCMFRILGFDRMASFKYSMILSIPPVLGATFLKTVKMVFCQNNISSELLNFSCISIGILVSFVCGSLALRLVERFLQRFTLSPFVIYRILFALFLVWRGL